MPTPSLRAVSVRPALGILIFLLGVFFLCNTPLVLADVTIHCLDVGQGDATLIVSSSGQTFLFDGGNNNKGYSVIVPYLNTLGIGTLDYMGASHYHADHVGGLDEVYLAKGVNYAVYDRGYSYTTATYNSYASTVSQHRTTITDGQVIDLGDGVTITCVCLNGNGVMTPPYDNSSYENEYSIGLLVECGDFDFFVGGDLIGIGYDGHVNIESSAAPGIDEIEVYQVNHQGSYTSSNSTFLTWTLPEVSIISVGNNGYGHPHQSVLDRLNAYGSFIYQTEAGSGGTLPPGDLRVVNGHVVITSDGYGEYFVDGDEWAMDEDDLSGVPLVSRFVLRGNHPNPFNPATNILFILGSGGRALLSVYDLSGRRVFSQRYVVAAGQQSITWHGTSSDGNTLPAGIYLYELATGDGVGRGKMTLVK